MLCKPVRCGATFPNICQTSGGWRTARVQTAAARGNSRVRAIRTDVPPSARPVRPDGPARARRRLQTAAVRSGTRPAAVPKPGSASPSGSRLPTPPRVGTGNDAVARTGPCAGGRLLGDPRSANRGRLGSGMTDASTGLGWDWSMRNNRIVSGNSRSSSLLLPCHMHMSVKSSQGPVGGLPWVGVPHHLDGRSR